MAFFPPPCADDDDDQVRPDFPFPPTGPDEDLVLQAGPERYAVPATINRYLRKYQREGIQFMFDRVIQNSGVILGDDMGLGKTIQVIGLLAALMGKTGHAKDDALSLLGAATGQVLSKTGEGGGEGVIGWAGVCLLTQSCGQTRSSLWRQPRFSTTGVASWSCGATSAWPCTTAIPATRWVRRCRCSPATPSPLCSVHIFFCRLRRMRPLNPPLRNSFWHRAG